MNPTRASNLVELTPPLATTGSRLPLKGWSLNFARRWNSGSYSVFVLHGNVFDLFPIQEGTELGFGTLKTFLARRVFSERSFLLFYDIGDGLTFGSALMQKRFFEWLEIYDSVEGTTYHLQGPPHDFIKLAPLLRRFFQHASEQNAQGITVIVDFAEKIVPGGPDSYSSQDERIALVTLLKWAASPEMRRVDVGIILLTESISELHSDILQNPHIAQIRIELPDQEERVAFLGSGTVARLVDNKPVESWSSLPLAELGERLAGLNLLRIHHLLAEALRNGEIVGPDYISSNKKRLIEEYCQGLVRFKTPKPGLSLDVVATHAAAKKKLRDLAWLIKNGKRDVLEKGVLLPGRVGVGKSFLVDCFASECGLPVMELAEFRSKWVGDTELQQARILLTIRALGPVIVVVDEADAVFGSRDTGAEDSGISARVFAAFAAHLGDQALRGRELWIAMTSRPDLLAIDMKRQGRFGLSLPLFPAQSPDEVLELFTVVAKTQKVSLSKETEDFIKTQVGDRPLTGSDVESILVRAREQAVLEQHDQTLELAQIRAAVESFIDPLDPKLLLLQELAAVLSCSDKRYLPARYLQLDRAALAEEFARLKSYMR